MAPGLTVIGLDAATLDVIEPLVAAGQLPNISRVLSGAAGTLRSTTHPLTPHAWVTMCTGVNAGRHGIWDFVERAEGGYDFTPVNGSHRRAPALWERLSGAGRRVGLVSVPFTWPAQEVNGFCISGFDAPAGAADDVHPRSIAEEVRRRFPDYRLDDKTPVGQGGEFQLDLVRRATEAKAGLTAWLSERFDPEFLFVVFMAADYVHHHSWPDWEANGADSRVAEVYRTLDAAVGTLLDPGRNVMIVSDHGGGALKGVVSLNGWLAQHGFLAYRAEPGRVRRRAARAASRLTGHEPSSVVLDWSRTRVFAHGMFGNLVINVRGRERHGVVAEHDYEPLRDEVARSLLELRSPEGEQVVRAVHRREDLFEGPQLARIPDLVVEFDEYAWLGTGSPEVRSEELWDRTAKRLGARGGWAGSHRPHGTVALCGPSVAAGMKLRARILDVAPTALSLLGEPVPAELEGRALTEALTRPVAQREKSGVAVATASGPEQPVRPYAPSEAEQVEGRLRSLGYLE